MPSTDRAETRIACSRDTLYELKQYLRADEALDTLLRRMLMTFRVTKQEPTALRDLQDNERNWVLGLVEDPNQLLKEEKEEAEAVL